jgi:hypothetical protein
VINELFIYFSFRGDLVSSFTFSAFQVYNNRLYDLISDSEVRLQKKSLRIIEKDGVYEKQYIQKKNKEKNVNNKNKKSDISKKIRGDTDDNNEDNDEDNNEDEKDE